jgi:hypothetical protein
MSDLAHYSPEDVIVLVAGSISIAGMAEGTFISITKEDAPFTTKTTADGVVSRNYTNSQVYNITLTLHSASSSNDVLTKLWLVDEATQRGKFSLLIKDPLGTSLFHSNVGWVSKTPQLDFGDKISNRDWTITCTQATINYGGNEDASILLDDLLSTPIGRIPAIARMI